LSEKMHFLAVKTVNQRSLLRGL